MTATSVVAIERTARLRQQAEIEQFAADLQAAISNRIEANTAYLRSGAAMFAEIDPMPALLFERYVRNLELDKGFHGAAGVGYLARKPADGAALAAGGSGLIVPGRNAVLFLEPGTQANKRMIGQDLATDPAQRIAMDQAERSGRAAATAYVSMPSDRGSRTEQGLIIFMPVYRSVKGKPALRGFLYSALLARELIAAAFSPASLPRGRIEIRDADVPVGPPVFEMTKGPPVAPSLATHSPATRVHIEDEGGSVTRRIAVAQRIWVLKVTYPTRATLSSMGMAALLAGLVTATLLLLITRMLLARAEEHRRALAYEVQQAGIRDSLTRELNHRVKNTLANVLSIISLTRRRASDLNAFAESLTHRIRGLSATHDLLTHSHWGTTLLSDVIAVELLPYGLDRHVSQNGPPVRLAPNDALSLGMAIHELVTNAAKFGALSVPEGSVHVEWKLIAEQLAQIDWREEGGPSVCTPLTRGFGTDLIEKIVAHELHSRVDLHFEAKGVRCRLLVPVRDAAQFQLRADAQLP